MKKAFYIILFFVIFFGVIRVLLPSLEDTPCILQKQFLKLEINGIVIKKYIDSNQHSYPMIEIRSNNSEGVILKVNLVMEKSHLFEKINETDYLHKLKGSNVVSIVENGVLRTIEIADFDCNIQDTKM